MSAPELKPEKLVAINKLKAEIERYLNITTVVEPSNAMSAIEVRIMFTGTQKLNQLPKPDGDFDSYVPYEWILPVVVSVRATGGNADHSLSGQAAWINLQLANYLDNELYEVRGVTQVIQVPRGLMQLGPMNRLRIIGDAEITDAKFISSTFSGDKPSDDYEPHIELFTYREDWNLNVVLTVHRDFETPELREVRFYNVETDEEIQVTNKESNS
ncbi:hypothetical protein [Vibrio sp. OPT18]|uniref:hypothetical protein n=1 Tax=Vibrio sp. OPT18 TaxID=2778641 RepID=UPI00188168A5|nr:hypothetical protein [Vibrio sp. OPT18]MBE8578636.1 hypothetical protein [Vibrio sp. OPT18]